MSTPEERRQQRREEEKKERRAEERREEERERQRDEERDEERRAEARQFARELEQAEERARARREQARAARARERRERERRSAAQERWRDTVREALLQREREQERERQRAEARREAARADARERERAEGRAEARREAARAEARERERAEGRAETRRDAAREEGRERDRAEARTEARREAARTEQRRQEEQDRATADREAQREDERAEARRGARRQDARDDERAQARREASHQDAREGTRAEERTAARRDAARAEQRAAGRRRRRRADAADARRGERAAAAAPTPPGWLRTRGRFVIDARGRPVTLRGVTARGLERARPRGDRFDPAVSDADLELLATWGANALVVPISQDLALEGFEGAFGEDYLEALDATVRAAATAGMHTVIQLSLLSSVLPTHVADGQERFDPALPNLESIDLWSVLGRRYAAEPAALFHLFQGPHAPEAGDSTGMLVPSIDWELWNRWLLAMVGEVRRVHPASLVIVHGLDGGRDLTGFPLRHSDGTHPANVVYAGTFAPDDPGSGIRGLDSLAKLQPCAVLGVAGRPDEGPALEATGRRFARASLSWFADELRDVAAPLVRDDEQRIVPTPLGSGVARGIGQPAGPDETAGDGVSGGPRGPFGLVARELTALILAQAAPPPNPWDTADSRANVLRHPVAAAATQEGVLAHARGGLETDASLRPRVSVILGPGATLRGIAGALLPLYTAAAPPVPPTAEQLARAFAVYSQTYLPVPSLAAYRVGMRIPLPIEIDTATGGWILSSARVIEWAALFDPAWLPVLDQRPAPLAPADEDGPGLIAAMFLGEFDTAQQRGIALLARMLTNPFDAVLPAFEILRLLGDDEAFFVTLAFFDNAVNHQLSLLASLTAGSGLLRRLAPILAAPPAALTPDQQQSLTRASAMLNAALRPGGVQADARELPETPQQLADRGPIPQAIRAAPQDPTGGLHRMVLGHDVLAGRSDVFNQVAPPHQFRGPAYMGRIEPGAFIAGHQAQLNPLGDQRLAERLVIVSAISPNEGALDAIRLRDAGILSTGVHQWSATFPIELPSMLWRYRSLAPLEFDLFFRLYGLEVRPDGADGNGNPRFMLQQIAPDLTVTDLATFAQKRTFLGGATAGGVTTFETTWAARFRLASTALSAYGLAQALEAAARFDRILREVGNLNVGGVVRPLSDVISSRHGAALILDQHINQPASVHADLQAAINFVVPQPNDDALDRAATNRYAQIRHLQDAAQRTARIVAVGLDPAHGSFAGW